MESAARYGEFITLQSSSPQHTLGNQTIQSQSRAKSGGPN